jgi:hypothetical protein
VVGVVSAGDAAAEVMRLARDYRSMPMWDLKALDEVYRSLLDAVTTLAARPMTRTGLPADLRGALDDLEKAFALADRDVIPAADVLIEAREVVKAYAFVRES